MSEQLLDAIIAAPDDDAARLAYANAIEAEDPARAALIRQALAHAKKPAKKTTVALRALVEQHGRRWLGDLADVVADDWLAFDRGILSACLVGPNGAAKYGGRRPYVQRGPVDVRAFESKDAALIERMKRGAAIQHALQELAPGAVAQIVGWRARDAKVMDWLRASADRVGAALELHADKRKGVAPVVDGVDVGWP